LEGEERKKERKKERKRGWKEGRKKEKERKIQPKENEFDEEKREKMEKEKIFHILQVNMLIFSVFVQVSPSCLNCCGISFRREELHLYLRVQVVTSRGGQCRLCGDKLQGYSPNNVLCWLSCFVSAWAQQIGRLRLPIEILKCK
jgi:hypothetical protein